MARSPRAGPGSSGAFLKGDLCGPLFMEPELDLERAFEGF